MSSSLHFHPEQPHQLAALTTREAVADAVYRAVAGLDSGDKALWDSAIAADHNPSFEIKGRVTHQGVPELDKNVFEHVAALDTTHTLSNVRININEDGKTASLGCYAVAQHYKPGQGVVPGAQHLMSGAFYNFDLIEDEKDGLWKMKKWVLELVWLNGDMSVVMAE